MEPEELDFNGKGDKEQKGFIKKFEKCPGCGSTDRYFEQLIGRLKEKGLVSKEVSCFDFQMQQATPVTSDVAARLPVGAEVPAFQRVWDTCLECGMVYTVLLQEMVSRKSPQIIRPQLQVPGLPQQMNRAERRRLGFN